MLWGCLGERKEAKHTFMVPFCERNGMKCGCSTRGLSAEQQQILLLFGTAVLLAIVVTVAHSLARFFSPTFGRPQGRYLFPALVPIATLFVLGLRGLVSQSFRLHLLTAYIGAFALFDALCIALYIIPAYYGY